MMNFSTCAIWYQWYARYFCSYRWRLAKSKTRFLDHRYTREAGVRSLDRKLGAICRAVAVKVAEGQRKEAKLECPDAAPEGEGLCPGRAPSGQGTRGGRGSMAPVDGEVDRDAARRAEPGSRARGACQRGRGRRPRAGAPRPAAQGPAAAVASAASGRVLQAAASRLAARVSPASQALGGETGGRRPPRFSRARPALRSACGVRRSFLVRSWGQPPPHSGPHFRQAAEPPDASPVSLFSGAVPACPPALSRPRLSHSFCSWGFFLFKNFCHFNRIWRGTLKINTCSDHHLKKSEFLKSALGG